MKVPFTICVMIAVGLVAAACREKAPGLAQGGHVQSERDARRHTKTEEARRRSALREEVLFDVDRSDIRPDARAILEVKAAAMRAAPALRVRIDGHTDERGSRQYNVALGLRRAAAVRAHLIKLGIDSSRLTTRTFGESRPVDPRHTEGAWARNRRAEFRVISPGFRLLDPDSGN